MGKRTIRVRRTFTPQFKKDAVHLVVEEGKSLTEVATHLGIARSLLQRWREQLTDTPTEAFPGRGRLAPQPRRAPREPGHLRLAASLPRLAQRGVRHRQASRRPAYATGGPARPRSSTVPIHRHPPLARPARRAEPDRPQLHRRGPQPPLARGHHSGPDPRGLALPRDPPRCLLAADCG